MHIPRCLFHFLISFPSPLCSLVGIHCARQQRWKSFLIYALSEVRSMKVQKSTHPTRITNTKQGLAQAWQLLRHAFECLKYILHVAVLPQGILDLSWMSHSIQMQQEAANATGTWIWALQSSTPLLFGSLCCPDQDTSVHSLNYKHRSAFQGGHSKAIISSLSKLFHYLIRLLVHYFH